MALSMLPSQSLPWSSASMWMHRPGQNSARTVNRPPGLLLALWEQALVASPLTNWSNRFDHPAQRNSGSFGRLSTGMGEGPRNITERNP
jgi:hypothetical protein